MISKETIRLPKVVLVPLEDKSAQAITSMLLTEGFTLFVNSLRVLRDTALAEVGILGVYGTDNATADMMDKLQEAKDLNAALTAIEKMAAEQRYYKSLNIT